MSNINPIMAEALAPFVQRAEFKDWGWINGYGVDMMANFQAERKRHDNAMQDGIGTHHAKYIPGHNVEGFACSCGFAWRMDYSG